MHSLTGATKGCAATKFRFDAFAIFSKLPTEKLHFKVQPLKACKAIHSDMRCDKNSASKRWMNRAVSVKSGFHGAASTLNGENQNSGDQTGLYSRLKTVTAILLLLMLTALLGAPAQAAAENNFSIASASKSVLSFVLHLDVHLSQIIAKHGSATYAILFAIVFCETGLVITPFLPGDSLLFAAGAFAALGHLKLSALLATFITAAILGDALNYQLGKMFGTKAKGSSSKLVKREYIEKTEAFYLKHGGKTVVLARFIPIVRTFAPFVAGVGTMPYGRFAAYNVGGAVLWSVLFVGAGAFLGNIPAVKHNFSIVVFAIVGVSLIPLLFEFAAARREAKLAEAEAQGKEVGEKVARVEQQRPEGGIA